MKRKDDFAKKFYSGVAGERFAVRNSGVDAVIEGVGDHTCEYMTGGRIIILSATGKNFAAGMSGGIAYVFDEHGDFVNLCNRKMVELTGIENEDEIEFVKNMIFRHVELIESRIATDILVNWEASLKNFVRVIPNDYRRVIEAQKQLLAEDLSKEDAEMAAFAAGDCERGHSLVVWAIVDGRKAACEF